MGLATTGNSAISVYIPAYLCQILLLDCAATWAVTIKEDSYQPALCLTLRKRPGGFTPWTPDRRAAGGKIAARHKKSLCRAAISPPAARRWGSRGRSPPPSSKGQSQSGLVSLTVSSACHFQNTVDQCIGICVGAAVIEHAGADRKFSVDGSGAGGGAAGFLEVGDEVAVETV
jgi:hypothetical protein